MSKGAFSDVSAHLVCVGKSIWAITFEQCRHDLLNITYGLIYIQTMYR